MTAIGANVEMSLGPRIDIEFASGSEMCRGWHYPALSSGAGPCVVMAHGFGATKEGGLDLYARRFQVAGLSVLVFDYRHFGASGGEPRQLLDISRQHGDWSAAITFARSLPTVDPTRVALWGSSFSGGHVLAIAARDEAVAAVVAQVPHVSGPATARVAGPRGSIRLGLAGVRDVAASLLGRGEYTVPIVAAPGELGAMTTPDAAPGYRAMYPAGVEWENAVAARIFPRLATYSPGRLAGRICCPLLVQVGEGDVVTPPAPAIDAAGRAPQGELVTYPIGHFDIYSGAAFERAVADQCRFYTRHLLEQT